MITQARTLDEIVANVREVVALMFNRKRVDIELLLPSQLHLAGKRRAIDKRRIAQTG